MSRVCDWTGKRYNNANSVSHSKRHTKRRQKANISYRRIFVPSENRWVRAKLSTDALRSIDKMGVDAFIKKLGIAL